MTRISKSAKGVDYTKLRDLLEAGEWKKADLETDNVMLKVANRESEGCLRESDIDNFPCEDLRTIDQLWHNYSDGKFGFSVQKEIFESLGGIKYYKKQEDWGDFGDHVGWRKKGNWLFWSDVIFQLDEAPRGHLPFDYFVRVEFFVDNFLDDYRSDSKRTYGQLRQGRRGGRLRPIGALLSHKDL